MGAARPVPEVAAVTTVLGTPPPGPVWRCEPHDDLDDLAALIRVWLTQTDRRRTMRPDDDDDEGRVHTPEEIAQAQAEVDEEIRQRQEAGARLAEKRRRRERDLYG